MFHVSARLHHRGTDLGVVSHDSVQNVHTLLLELTRKGRKGHFHLHWLSVELQKLSQDVALGFFLLDLLSFLICTCLCAIHNLKHSK